MPIATANLILTVPKWLDDPTNPAIVGAMKKVAAQYWLDVHYQPLSNASVPDDAKCRAFLRELNDLDQPKDQRKLFLIAANPLAPESIEKIEGLQLALKLRSERIKFLATDDDTALALTEITRFCNISRTLQTNDVQVPITPGSGLEIANWIEERIEPKDLCLVIQQVEENNLVAKSLMDKRIRVLKLPTVKISKLQLDNLPDNDLPNYLLVNDAISVAVAKQGFITLGIDPAGITFVGVRPSLKAFAKKQCPESNWLDVPDLSVASVMDAVSKDG